MLFQPGALAAAFSHKPFKPAKLAGAAGFSRLPPPPLALDRGLSSPVKAYRMPLGQE